MLFVFLYLLFCIVGKAVIVGRMWFTLEVVGV